MYLIVSILFLIYIFNLNFFLNEEILLFITFCLFFFFMIKFTSFFLLKSLNLIRYKIYNKFIKIMNIYIYSFRNIRSKLYIYSIIYDFVNKLFLINRKYYKKLLNAK